LQPSGAKSKFAALAEGLGGVFGYQKHKLASYCRRDVTMYINAVTFSFIYLVAVIKATVLSCVDAVLKLYRSTLLCDDWSIGAHYWLYNNVSLGKTHSQSIALNNPVTL
jgi:hypothetical protein